MRTFSFEKLNVWQKSRELTVAIYSITKQFPEEECFGLSSQMRRCAISLGSNIAEGTGRHTNKDKARFTEIAYGSGLELLNQCILSFDLGMITQEQHDSLRAELTEILAMLDGLYKSQLNS
ncbi:four helix bundle protein [Muricauda sp. CAU 1633]|uniref:four helix bundle protein n=1 Tax=Allomuricauda sp. CAU 1633 TaxID=2816036 RepID=UPI001A8ECE60|nr:four helix bundle protein [Muricauda sp. CAU 1633]MBO0320783.1 four helix bundle protein [Muricauda sp. CAU 1633]